MALLHYLHANAKQYGITISALNCDHRIRGESSAKDSAFVKERCFAYGVPLLFFEWEFDGNKTESAARQWRRQCYEIALRKSGRWNGADFIATAHHLNDNAETVLFNLARGSALAGVTGISDCEKIIRPLIAVSRGEIDDYIKENAISFVEDETNFTDDYTRNKIRRKVLPELESAVPGAAKAIFRFSRLAAEDELYFKNIINSRGLVNRTESGCRIYFCEETVIFKRAVLSVLEDWNVKDYTSAHAQTLYELQFKENGKKFEFLGLTAIKEDGCISIVCGGILNDLTQAVSFKEYVDCGYTRFCGGYLYFGEDLTELSEKYKNSKILKFDADKIPRGATVRFMREGDRFKKFAGGEKSLGDFFTDRKIPLRIRRKVPLIADGKEILAVCGIEISDKVKITDKTQKVLFAICGDLL